MWTSDYDENLSENIFFIEISTKHADILQRASLEDWLICIPRADSITEEDITIETILDHILIPTKHENSQFYTLSKKLLTISNGEITTTNQNDAKPVKILFQETFYIKDFKCNILCLQHVLFSKKQHCDGHRPVILETLHDCIDYLWGNHLGAALGDIQKQCEKFKYNNPEIYTEDLQTQKDLVGNLYSQCLQVGLNSKNLPENDTLTKLKISIETYMQSCLDDYLIKSINTYSSHDDAIFNKIVRNCCNLQLKHFNISNKFCDIITSAKSELSKINNYNTALDKINCLKNTFNYFYSSNEKIYIITSDEVLQILIFLIIKSNIANWNSNLIFLTRFNFSVYNEINETSFIITTLEAAIEFIKSGNLQQNSDDLINSDNREIFQAIFNQDLTLFQSLLNYTPTQNNSSESDANIIKLCHPLCSCSKCIKSKSSESCNINLTNSKGQNYLIIATILNSTNFVEFLISINFDLNYQDYSGKSALHYANYHGFQNLVLILINAKADVNLKDNDANSALHLSCNNGHENCVKALLYTAKNIVINCVNKNGETPLHFAVKNNFLEIIKILIENGANTLIRNKKNQTPLDLSSNYKIDSLLQSFNNDFKIIKACMSLNINASSNNKNIQCEKQHGIRPKSVAVIKKLDLLIKAIENNDFPLTCFYLGFNNNSTSEYDFKSKCHPLCNCEKCEEIEKCDDLNSSQEQINVNYCNIDGFTPLHIAAKAGKVDIVRILLDSQALVNLKTYRTLQSPLHLACINQNLGVVKELIKCPNCVIDSQDYKGNTPLYYAASKNNKKIVEVLLKNGANPNILNYFGTSTIKEVQDKCLFGVSKLLNNVQLSDDSFL